MNSTLSTNCIRKDIGGRIVLGKRLYNGATLTSSSITNPQVKLLKPYTNAETTDPLQDWTDASVISSGADDGVIYYDVSAALCDTLGTKYQAIFRYTASSLTHYADMLWHIVLHVLDLTVTAEDLNRELTSLEIFTDITTAHKNRFIESAHRKVWSKLKAHHLFPWQVWDNGGLNECIKLLSLAKLCFAQAKSGNDTDEVWAWKYNEYIKAFHEAWEELDISYAHVPEGVPVDDTAASEAPIIR